MLKQLPIAVRLYSPLGCTAISANRTETASQDRVGWTLGGGVEAMFASNWLLRGEYRYADFGSMTFTRFVGPVTNIDAFTATVSYRTHTALIGLAYKFGGPVVAKY